MTTQELINLINSDIIENTEQKITGTILNNDLINMINSAENVNNKGTSNGYASLDNEGLVPDSQLADSITNEPNVRASADTVLQTNIDNETTRATTAENTLTTNLNAEESTRVINDNTLQTNIDAETTDRNNADINLQTQINATQGSLRPQGNWNANTNSPDITNESTTGHFWIVGTAGSTDVGGITDWKTNDWVVKTDNGWAKIDNTDLVNSVAGKLGDVILTKADVGLSNVDNTSDASKPISNATQTALGTEMTDRNNADITLQNSINSNTTSINNNTTSINANANNIAKKPSGTYTPTLITSTNVSSVAFTLSQYQKNDNIVEVYVRVTINVNSVGVNTKLYFSLPIGSNIEASADVIGHGASVSSNTNSVMVITGDNTHNAAQITTYPGASSTSYMGSFSYIIK